jgi:hypothetical protein
MGGLGSPWTVELPPLLPKCTFTVKKVFPVPLTGFHCATSGFRLLAHASAAGSMRPGLYESMGQLGLEASVTTSVLSLGPPWFGL